jgi:hypothetical protein
VSATLRCAVLFALPTDRDEFNDVASGRVLRDYGRGLMRGLPTDTVWAGRYVRIVDAIADLCDAVAALEGQAYRAATLCDLTRASASCDIVIIIAHWRGWQVTHDDLAEPPAAVECRLHAAGLGDLLGRRGMSSGELVSTLNQLIETGTLQHRLVPEADAFEPGALLAATLGRDALDAVLGGAIHPGNRVELYDGLHEPGAIEGAIVPDFSGSLDLATCASLPLATVIKMRRGSRVRVVHTVDAVDPLPCCRMIAAALRFAQQTGESYPAARLTIDAAFREHASRQRWNS